MQESLSPIECVLKFTNSKKAENCKIAWLGTQPERIPANSDYHIDGKNALVVLANETVSKHIEELKMYMCKLRPMKNNNGYVVESIMPYGFKVDTYTNDEGNVVIAITATHTDKIQDSYTYVPGKNSTDDVFNLLNVENKYRYYIPAGELMQTVIKFNSLSEQAYKKYKSDIIKSCGKKKWKKHLTQEDFQNEHNNNH